MLDGQKKRKDKKTWKSRSKEKLVGFSSTSLFPTRKQETVTQGGKRGTNHLTWRRTQGLGMSKAGRTSEKAGAFQIHLHKTRIARVRVP